MATITAEAKLYTGIRSWCVDKNISANLTSSFSLGNQNQPSPVLVEGVPTVYAGVKVEKLIKFIADIEAIGSVSLTNERYLTYGGGNNVITPSGTNNTNNWKVNAEVACKFPTYIRIDIEKLQLPEGTDCIVQLEEGWLLDGDYPGSFNSPSARNDDFIQFRTPWYGLSFMNSAFSVSDTVLRIKQLAGSSQSSTSIFARGTLNPGKLAALEVANFTVIPRGNYIAVFASQMQPSTANINLLPLKIKQLEANTNFTSQMNIPNTQIVIFFEAATSAEFSSLINNIRVRFLQNQNIFATSNFQSEMNRFRGLASNQQSTVFFYAKTGRIKQFSATSIVATSSMNCTANKIGLLYEKLNPNASGTPQQDWFGWDVAINNTYFAASAPQEDEGADANTGRVYVYNTSDGNLVNTLVGNTYNSFGTPVSDQFGSSLAFNPSNAVELAVGTPYEDNGYSNNGRVNVINASNGSIISTYQLSAVDATGSWEQGQDVDINNNYVVLGSRVRVDVYNRSTGNIAFSLPININDAKVAISGNNIIVGYSATNTAYIYNASTGALIRTLTGPTASSGFGISVAINGTYAVVGSRNYDTGGYLDVGRVYVYNLSNGALVNTLDYPSPNRDYIHFGGSVSISNTHILVGGIPDSSDGHYHLFEINGTRIRSWEEGGTGVGDSVAIFGDYFIVGGIWKTSSSYTASGSVKVYSLNKP